MRLRQICLAAHDLYAPIDALQAAFGLQVAHGKADLTRYGLAHEPPAAHSAAFFAKHGLVNALLPVGDDFIEVVAPTRPDAPVTRFLARRGEGAGYMVIVEVESLAPYAERAREQGVRIAGGADYPQYGDLHLDPRDTFGAMLAFSEQREGRPMDGGWYPAGAHWRPSGATSFGLRAAEIGCKNPQETARRWSALFGRPAEKTGDVWRIALDGAEARFTPVREGGLEGLVGVDMASPGEGAREALISGVRFRRR